MRKIRAKAIDQTVALNPVNSFVKSLEYTKLVLEVGAVVWDHPWLVRVWMGGRGIAKDGYAIHSRTRK